MKITSDKDFVQTGDSVSYANPLVAARGGIDSVEVHIIINRFSDNGIHPNIDVIEPGCQLPPQFYFHDGTRFGIINAKITNLFFQKRRCRLPA